MIRTEKRPGVLVVILDRPPARNALDLDMVVGLRSALAEIGGDTRVVVLRSAVRGVFCLGMDLAALEAGLASGAGPGAVRGATGEYVGLLQQIASLRAISIAEVNGLAVGGGVDLLAACDLALAADDAAFSIAQLRKGVFPLTTSGVVIPRIGQAAFLYWLLSGQNYSADKVHRLGLVCQVAPPEELSSRCDALVDRILGYDPEALAIGIEALRTAREIPTAERLSYLGSLLALNCHALGTPAGARSVASQEESRTR